MSATGKILVVDDEERNLRLIEALLAPRGHSILFAPDGPDGAPVRRRGPARPGPAGRHHAGHGRIRGGPAIEGGSQTSVIPIVMVTALKDVADRVKALEAGADDFLNKPVDKTELRARVKSLLKVKAYNDHMLNYQKELEEEVARQTQQLRKAFEKVKAGSLETIYRLSVAAEYKDEDTGRTSSA